MNGFIAQVARRLQFARTIPLVASVCLITFAFPKAASADDGTTGLEVGEPAVVVPEPATLIYFGLAAATLFRRRRHTLAR